MNLKTTPAHAPALAEPSLMQPCIASRAATLVLQFPGSGAQLRTVVQPPETSAYK